MDRAPVEIVHRPDGRLPVRGRLRVLAAAWAGRDVTLTVTDGRQRTTINPR